MTPALQDLADQDGQVDRDWLSSPHRGVVPPDVDAIAFVRAFLMERWVERAAERGLPVPSDLSSSCKFGSLFSKCLFGGEIKGHYDHLYVVADGRVVDLSEGAADVAALPDPYLHDDEFLSEPDLAESLMSCLPRVTGWVEAILPEFTEKSQAGLSR